jgi:hypothetical protein
LIKSYAAYIERALVQTSCLGCDKNEP